MSIGKNLQIGDRKIGDRHPVFIIAELSANHAGKLENALETVRAAKRAGADAIKLQTYTADTITIKSDLPDFIVKGETLWDGRTLYDLYEEAHTPWEWHQAIFEEAHKQGLICFSSPFDETAVNLLENLNAPAYKIASFEITDIPLIRYAASKQKPIIISTGIASSDDIGLAIKACHSEGNNQIILLKCTSAYPAKPEEANLKMMEDLRSKFGVLVGLSDHTLGIAVPVAATALGAVMIEKHLILDKSLGGPDAAFSLDEQEFKQMVDAVRMAQKSLGSSSFEPTESSAKGKVFSRSLYIVADVKAGEILNKGNVRSIRPGHGMAPRYLPDIIGRRFRQDYTKGTRLSMDMLE